MWEKVDKFKEKYESSGKIELEKEIEQVKVIKTFFCSLSRYSGNILSLIWCLKFAFKWFLFFAKNTWKNNNHLTENTLCFDYILMKNLSDFYQSNWKIYELIWIVLIFVVIFGSRENPIESLA